MIKFPKFAEAKHEGYEGRYAIDWNDGERVYKQLTGGIRVYENDVVSVTGNGDRDPYWRKQVFRSYGLDFRMADELTNKKLFKQDGTPIFKKHVNINCGPFLYIKELGRLYAARAHGDCYERGPGGIRFLSEHAQPVSYTPVVVEVPNKVRLAEFRKTISEYVNLGHTLNALTTSGNSYIHAYEWDVTKFLKNAAEGHLPRDLTDEGTQLICRAMARYKSHTDKQMHAVTCDVYKETYLLVKEN